MSLKSVIAAEVFLTDILLTPNIPLTILIAVSASDALLKPFTALSASFKTEVTSLIFELSDVAAVSKA